MADTKFTLGPWAMSYTGKTVSAFHTIETPRGERSSSSHIASLSKNVNREADARLIAAAPELYAKVAIAATIFREYERLHLAKGTADGAAKAKRNAEYAEEMEMALAKASGEPPASDLGKAKP